MTTATFRSISLTQTPFERVQTAALQLATRIQTARARRSVFKTTFAELAQLSDRDLADIGIHRSNIRAIAAEQANIDFPRS